MLPWMTRIRRMEQVGPPDAVGDLAQLAADKNAAARSADAGIAGLASAAATTESAD
jgi:hypothetical protein